MFDFNAIGKVGETLQKAADDIDTRLTAIETMTQRGNVLTAMLVSELYAARTGRPADVAGVLAQADLHAGTATFAAPDGDHYAGMPGDDVPTVPIEHSGKLPDVDWSNDYMYREIRGKPGVCGNCGENILRHDEHKNYACPK